MKYTIEELKQMKFDFFNHHIHTMCVRDKAFIDYCFDLVAFMRRNEITEIKWTGEAAVNNRAGECTLYKRDKDDAIPQLSWADLLHDSEPDIDKIKHDFIRKTGRFKFKTKQTLTDKIKNMFRR